MFSFAFAWYAVSVHISFNKRSVSAMRKSKMLQKIRAGKVAQICSMGNYNPSFICHAAHYNFDGIWLSLEHRAMDEREIQAILAFFHLYDIDCFLRPSTIEKNALYRYLEDGAAGFMIPHVSTQQKAEELVQAVKFPPLGDRGLDGAGLDCNFHLEAGGSYTDDANNETFLIVQIETLEAVENIDAIVSVAGVDGVFIGPGDLGLRINNSNTSITLESTRHKVAEACAKHGKAWGIPSGNEEQLTQYKQEGAQILVYGGEFMALKNMLEESKLVFNRACEE